MEPVDRTGESEEVSVVLARAVALAGVGFVAVVAWALVFGALLGAAGIDPGPRAAQAISAVALGLGTGTVALGYLAWSGRGLGYVDLRGPDRSTLAYVVGGIVVVFGIVVAVDALLSALDVQTADHGVARRAASGDPTILLVLIPASWLLIGPGEELLYRNVVQKTLAEVLSPGAAVGVASVVFALAHVPAYAAGAESAVSLVSTLAIIFSLSVVLGVAYARTRNVLVPALVHGTYNAVVFALLYLDLAG